MGCGVSRMPGIAATPSPTNRLNPLPETSEDDDDDDEEEEEGPRVTSRDTGLASGRRLKSILVTEADRRRRATTKLTALGCLSTGSRRQKTREDLLAGLGLATRDDSMGSIRSEPWWARRWEDRACQVGVDLLNYALASSRLKSTGTQVAISLTREEEFHLWLHERRQELLDMATSSPSSCSTSSVIAATSGSSPTSRVDKDHAEEQNEEEEEEDYSDEPSQVTVIHIQALARSSSSSSDVNHPDQIGTGTTEATDKACQARPRLKSRGTQTLLVNSSELTPARLERPPPPPTRRRQQSLGTVVTFQGNDSDSDGDTSVLRAEPDDDDDFAVPVAPPRCLRVMRRADTLGMGRGVGDTPQSVSHESHWKQLDPSSSSSSLTSTDHVQTNYRHDKIVGVSQGGGMSQSLGSQSQSSSGSGSGSGSLLATGAPAGLAPVEEVVTSSPLKHISQSLSADYDDDDGDDDDYECDTPSTTDYSCESSTTTTQEKYHSLNGTHSRHPHPRPPSGKESLIALHDQRFRSHATLVSGSQTSAFPTATTTSTSTMMQVNHNNNNQDYDPKVQKSYSRQADEHDDDGSERGGLPSSRSSTPTVEVASQTVSDWLTDDSPKYSARPPPTLKREIIPRDDYFRDIDLRAMHVPAKVLHAPPSEDVPENNDAPSTPALPNLTRLVTYLGETVHTDLYHLRALFRWISVSLDFAWTASGRRMSSEEIVAGGVGVAAHYCQLLRDLCTLAGLRARVLRGFAKGHDYRPGHKFLPHEDNYHHWVAVFIMGAWRLVDPTWSSGTLGHDGEWTRGLNEHYFLTDPEVLIWTHFPYDEADSSYARWQLLDKPITLEEFNEMPKVTPYFFAVPLQIRSRLTNPVIFRVQTEIKLGSHEPMRYKYKLYPSHELENDSLNQYVFCQLKEDRRLGSFTVTPPIEGRYYLKVFAKPEKEMNSESGGAGASGGTTGGDLSAVLVASASTSGLAAAAAAGSSSSSSPGGVVSQLGCVATFLLECVRARKYIEPWPLNELPWGPTQAFVDYKMKLHGQTGPVIQTWGGKRRLQIESHTSMLITFQIFDSDGMELDARTTINRQDVDKKINFTIQPPRVGTFKFVIFGMPKPSRNRGKFRLPLLATFLIDCKMVRAKHVDEDEGVMFRADSRGVLIGGPAGSLGPLGDPTSHDASSPSPTPTYGVESSESGEIRSSNRSSSSSSRGQLQSRESKPLLAARHSLKPLSTSASWLRRFSSTSRASLPVGTETAAVAAYSSLYQDTIRERRRELEGGGGGLSPVFDCDPADADAEAEAEDPKPRRPHSHTHMMSH